MSAKRFGTFEGVFTPTLLSILGVIMYLRLGWVVGTVGLKGAIIIIVLGNLITLFTCLSISSITTNMRVGTGGAYALISKSLGFEAGGAIGIPLYLSQAISVAFYIAGFSECWVAVFPTHPFIFVSLTAWFILLLITFISARLAFRLQFAIIALIVLSLVSVFLGNTTVEYSGVIWRGMPQWNFWMVFAIFFPAVTGILAGVSMSGELKEPERNIPLGTLSAVGVSFIIYLLLATKFAHTASAQELVRNTSAIIGIARWRLLVIMGIMGATISSALSMFVASPRTLLALGKHRVIPLSHEFARVNKKSEPSTAILFTAFLALCTIAVGTLDKIAILLTMFFLITYGMLNLSVFIEKGIGIISFRPVFKVPLIFSFFGALGCIFVMFLINPWFSTVAILIIALVYFMLLHMDIRRHWPDVRKGLFIYIAEQAIKIAMRLPYHPKIWKPNLLILVGEPKNWFDVIPIIKGIVSPSGRVAFLTIAEPPQEEKEIREQSEKNFLPIKQKLEEGLKILSAPLQDEAILVSHLVAESKSFMEGASTAMQALKGSTFAPNALFLKLGQTAYKDRAIDALMNLATALDLGVIILHPHGEKFEYKQGAFITLWIREGSPNLNLALLMALQLEKNFEAHVSILQVAANAEEQTKAYAYLKKLKKIARLPQVIEARVVIGSFEEQMQKAPFADINIFGMPEHIDIAWMRSVAEKLNTAVLFLRDSKQESAIA